ncbi:MAG: DNA repair protein RecN [Deltaproteobacteria bacterium RIFCSPHIGHO2_12_FULL_43_9]|nr:MAG: DNA repair protein RecN [Deltaproteobacteria bacterium RIFCSPHIGHO2_12_FULL_43_9]
MIERLSIKNFAIVDHIEIDFGPGLNIVTGETGAGKSIIVGAFALLLGRRSQGDLVKPGTEEAVLEALFRVAEYPEVKSRLAESGFNGSDELLIRRTINVSGKSKIFINGQIATLNLLENITEPLVEICSQHENLRLLKSSHQMEIIDRFGKLERECSEVEEVYLRVTNLIDKYKEHIEKGISQEREELLRFQIKDIESAELILGEDEDLNIECQRLTHAEKFRESLGIALHTLDEDDDAVLRKVGLIKESLMKLSQIDPIFSDASERVEKCRIELEDIAFTLSKSGERFDLSPDRLEFLNSRIAKINALKRKYGASIEEVLEKLEGLNQELHSIEHFEEVGSELKNKILLEEKNYNVASEKLSSGRRRVGSRLSKQVEQILSSLGMPKVEYKIDMIKRPLDEGLAQILEGKLFLGPKGFDKAEMLFTSNPGIEPRPLAKVASGGELSRITLAIKKIIAESGGTSVYLFDEVDTGIGGAVAEVVGRNLKDVSRYNQVICITHLPQVAAYADNHFIVSKESKNNVTYASISHLNEKERVDEIARMLGGLKITATTTKHASEMLKMAQEEIAIQ